MFRRHRSSSTPLPTVVADEGSTSRNDESRRRNYESRRRNDEESSTTPSSRELLIMGQNHIIAFLVIMYVLLLICRLGCGWTPGRAAPISIDMVPLHPKNVTVVTAYFDIPSKRLAQDYLPWIRRFMTLQDNMIIFTSLDQVPLFNKLREHQQNTKVIAISLDEARVVTDFGGMDFWQRQADLDPEKYLHSKELYVIWNEKGHFLERAMELNPYGSDFFAWVDMGYLRDSLLENQRMIRYLPTIFTRNQALFLDVRKLVGDQNYLGGGFIGGYKEGLARWIKEYYALLNANRDRFIGKDQPWMFETCLQNQGLCLLVEPRDTYGDAWFYMAPLLHGVSKYGTMDHLLHAARSSRLYRFVQWMTRERIDLSTLTTGENDTTQH
jgi:Bacterial protein of unknown function (HtrL_YibB)